jgi:hypothetical protein
MMQNLLLLVFSAQLNLECFKERIFESSRKEPYAKTWINPIAAKSCLDTIENSDSTVSNIKVHVDTIACRSEFDFSLTTNRSWDLEWARNILSFYSKYDSTQYVELGEYSGKYKYPEILAPCNMYGKVYYGGRGTTVHIIFRCQYPSIKPKQCKDILDY